MLLSISLPYEPIMFGIKINMHLVLEYLAFFVGFRYYLYLRKRTTDTISTNNRLSIIIGAVFGALFFSRLIAFLENPPLHYSQGIISLLNNKTIMGGLFGGILGVELVKKVIGEKQSSGDLFTLPIILGITIGRLGCFLAGTKEFTYGKETTFYLGMDLGDGLYRHPIALYEIVFLIGLFLLIKQLQKSAQPLKNGSYFKIFMVSYFSFRFMLEFLKPNSFFLFDLSGIQYLCLLCLLYYYKSIGEAISYARKKLYLL
ncbi:MULTISPECIES: prolipoprotein diacylglyceryl transferase [unclassified Arenibacter]|uniref:prolipoprotein diacylglyceryl transferase n=1 Tax=unclassified Arenibacter TaxID=2615047 RepID=UPI000E35486A|nr:MULTISPECIES: prolipoprotein diacylglyceryl transferase family protein [unclassified Arenibacter]MCM4165377.1 diacylglyceryl transferase [Arenibacter sp. A80]RFT54854.1 diacylglyceryl transferase [Arenibacter sp. P308M17]